MTCSKCGAENEGSTFCYKCGEPLTDPWQMPTMQEMNRIVENAPKREAAPTVAMNADLVGYTIENRYRLDAKIGTGGMGAVYRATRLMIGDTVAIKILHQEQGADPQLSERFRREAQAAARLKHPNAVSIYDFGVTQTGLLYLVMELVEGRTLRQMIVEQGSIPLTTAVEIIRQVCSALDDAHRFDVIHRDIKPDNIVISETLNGLRVKVLDFGIAKLKDRTVSNLTQTGSVVGTPHYMSPEQCIGEELDGRSDIYSLGVVLYEMLTGRVPFNAPISTAVVVQHVNDRPPSLRASNPGIPASVEGVVMHTLEKRREARPQTAGLLAQELAAAALGPQQTQPSPVRPPSVVAFNAPHASPIPAIPSSAMPTLVMNTPQGNQPVVPGAVPVYNPTNVKGKDSVSIPLLIAVVALAVLAGSALTYLLVSGSNNDSSSTTSSATPESNRNRKTENTSSANSATATSSSTPATTVTPNPVTSNTTNTNTRPAGATGYAVSQYTGVNIRESPTKDSALIKTVNKGQGMWVFRESSNFEEVYIRSDNRYVNSNWSEVQLDNDPSVRGWVFNGFISK